MRWPEVVPILSAEDIHKGGYTDGKGKFCLHGWIYLVSGWNKSTILHWPVEYDEVLAHTIADAIEAAMSRKEFGRYCIEDFNDCEPARRSAALWNRTMRKLGYAVPCDRPKEFDYAR